MGRHTKILGYILFFEKFIGNEKKTIFYSNLNENWEERFGRMVLVRIVFGRMVFGQSGKAVFCSEFWF